MSSDVDETSGATAPSEAAIGQPESATPPGFACPVCTREDTVVLFPTGELDMATVSRFEHAAGEALAMSCARLLIDLRELTFIDSSGVRAVLRLQARIGETPQLELLPGPAAVQRVFELAGLTAALPFRTET